MGDFNVMNNTSLIPGPKKLPAIAGWSARRDFTVYIYIYIALLNYMSNVYNKNPPDVFHIFEISKKRNQII